MRKRKSPIVLLTALIVVVAGVAGFNFATSRVGGNPAEQPPAPEGAPPTPVGQARPAESTANVASTVKQAMGTKPTAPPADPEAMPKGPPGMPGGGSLILNPGAGAKPEKPKPNSSATSAQWYDKDSALGSGKG